MLRGSIVDSKDTFPWGLYFDDHLLAVDHSIFRFFHSDLDDKFNCSLQIYNVADVISGGKYGHLVFDHRNFIFKSFLDSLNLQLRLLSGHPWETNSDMRNCINHVLSHCNSWEDFFDLKQDDMKGVDFWHFSLPYFYDHYFFLVPWMTYSDDAEYILGLDFLKKLCEKKNEAYDYRPYDFAALSIHRVSGQDLADFDDEEDW